MLPSRTETRVGPKGYIHGWIFVGVPGVGAKVFHPHHGHGTVTGVEGKHATVRFGSSEHAFEHHPKAPGEPGAAPHLEPRPESLGGEPGVMSAAEAKKWGNANWPGPDKLPRDQYVALRNYSGPGAYQINRYLRTGKIPQPGGGSRVPNAREKAQLDSIIASIDRATKDHPTPTQAMVVHRGTGLAEFGGVTPDKLIGKEVREKAFLSTSVGKSLSSLFGTEDVHLQIHVPAGTPAFYLDKISSHKGERELLLGKGLHYKILSAKKVRGRWVVDAEIVLPKGGKRTAQTPVLSTVHHPFGSPAGPGLWHHKGLQLPAYIQNVAHAFAGHGVPESEAIARAVGVVRDWAEGRTPNGKGHVHPDVHAAAVKAIAEWEALKAASGGGKKRTYRAEVPIERRYQDGCWG